jgi:hypothetical protein
VLFAPQLIDVEANGRRIQEMHVDGGSVTAGGSVAVARNLKQLAS